MEERKRLQKVMLEIFQQEFQTLNTELQLILIDDMLTVFHNRLTILKKIQQSKEIQLRANDSSVAEPKWLTEDIKKIFNFEVSVLKNGLRVTKLTPEKKNL
jgi:hypothetical protein